MWHPGHIQYPSNYILCQKHVCLSVCCHNFWVCFGPFVRNALYVHYVASIRSVVIFVSIFDMFHRRLGRYCILNLQKKTKQTIATEGTREADRNPNLWYLPKPNILLKPNILQITYPIVPICNYSVSAEYSVRYSAEYFGRNRFRSDSNWHSS